MSPLTHLLASWVVAVHTTDNSRDMRLVALSGVAPDLDGLGIFVDWTNQILGRLETNYYQTYHHWYGHGIAAALLTSALLACFARRRWRVFGLAFAVFHLHLLCDLVGSRGPSANDFWPIHYFGPFRILPMWIWSHQWRLDGWQNQVITIVLLIWSMSLALKKGHSFVGVVSARFDAIFVSVLRKWKSQIAARSASAN